MRTLIQASGSSGTEVWVTDTLNDALRWWQGWWTPKPIEQWWQTLPDEWHFVGHAERTMTRLERSFLSCPHPDSTEFQAIGGQPYGYVHEDVITDRLEVHRHATLRVPMESEGKGSRPKYAPRAGMHGRAPHQGANPPSQSMDTRPKMKSGPKEGRVKGKGKGLGGKPKGAPHHHAAPKRSFSIHPQRPKAPAKAIGARHPPASKALSTRKGSMAIGARRPPTSKAPAEADMAWPESLA